MRGGVQLLGVALAIALCGCSTSPGFSLIAPGTWFSSREAKAADRAGEQREEKREVVLKAAQIEVAKTTEALTVAPDSREVELARQFNGNAEALLGQSIGPIKLADLVALRKLVADLRSDNAELRSAAEATQRASEARAGKLSAQLDDAAQKLAASQTKLREAFERENALADQLRTQRAWLWIAAGAAVLGGAAWLYLKFTIGGLPGAMAQGLSALRAKGVIPPRDEDNIFDAFLDRAEKKAIARHLP